MDQFDPWQVVPRQVVNCKLEQKHSDVEEPKILGRFQVFYGDARKMNDNLRPKMKISSQSERKFQQPKTEMEAVGMLSVGRMGPARSDEATGAYKMISESKLAGAFHKKVKGNTVSTKQNKKIEGYSRNLKQKLAKKAISRKLKRKLALAAISGKPKTKLVKESFSGKPKRKLANEAFSGKTKKKLANEAFNKKPKRKLAKEAFNKKPKRKLAKEAFNKKPKKKLAKEAFNKKPKKKLAKEAFNKKPKRKLAKEAFNKKPKRKLAKEAFNKKPKRKLAREAFNKKPKRKLAKEAFNKKPKRKLAKEAFNKKPKRKLAKEAFNKKPKRKLAKEAFNKKPKKKLAKEAFNKKPKRKLAKEAFSGKPNRKFVKKVFNTKPKRKLAKEAFSGKPKRKLAKKSFSMKPNKKLDKEFFSDKPKHKQAKNAFSMKPNKKNANEIFNKKPKRNKAKEEFVVKSNRQPPNKEAVSMKPKRKLTKNYSNMKSKRKMTKRAFNKKEIQKLPKEAFSRKPNRKLTKEAFSKKPKDNSSMAKRDKNIGAYNMEKTENVAKDVFAIEQENKMDKEAFNIKATKNLPIARKEKEIGSFNMKPNRKINKDAIKLNPKVYTATTRDRKITEEHQSNVISDDEQASEIRSNKEMNKLKAQLKESLRVSKRLIKEVGTLKQMVNIKATSDANDDEKEDLKALLKETVAVNKRLKKQIKRQKQIWSALQQMCKAVDGRLHGQNKNETESPKTEETHKTAQDSFSIQPLSISIQSLPHPAVKFEFRASTPHPVIEGYAVTTDRRTHKAVSRMEYRRKNNTFAGNVDVSLDHKIIEHMFITIVHKQDYLNVNLNMKNITGIKYQTLAPVDIFIEKPNGTIVAPKEKSLNVSFFAHGNVGLISEVEASFRGLNVSTDPQTIFMIYSYFDDIHITTTNISGNKLCLSVAISEEHARVGGILQLDVMVNTEHYDSSVFREIVFGRAFEILSSETQTVVPPNSIGLLPLQNTTLINSPAHSLICYAMGNPKPGISLVRGTKDGWEEIQPDQILSTDEFSVLKKFVLNASNTNIEGKYICSATNTQGNVISATEVLIHEPLEIRRSDVVVNGTRKMEITCVASGKPVPRVELRLYYEIGPDLAEFPSRYKITRFSPDSRTSLLSVTISPVDTDIFRVYCHAYSEGSMPQSVPIEVFPEPPEGPNLGLLHELSHPTPS